MKKGRILIIILSIIIISVCSYVHIGKINIHHKIEVYLKDRGYKDNELKSIEVTHSFMNILLSYDEWVISVIYNDEPNARYYYNYENGYVLPEGFSGPAEGGVYKHADPEPIYK
jgi:hypothetical protein